MPWRRISGKPSIRLITLVIDGGFCGVEPTTVISLIDGYPEILRHGKGDVSFLE